MAKMAVISFPGNNCEVESLRVIKKAGMEPLFFRWNDDIKKLAGCDGYFIPGGFSYEDRGRAGMIAARDEVMEFVKSEAAAGKVVIGNCNGAQILVESGLVPFGEHLQMSLARNARDGQATGFLSQWIAVTPACSRDRCATSDWEGVMPMPMAHAEGRFTTKDKDLYEELKKHDQIAFSYCDLAGNVQDAPEVNPNGSEFAIAGICNAAGNVVALMPHPERTPRGEGNRYFESVKNWIEQGKSYSGEAAAGSAIEWEVGEAPPAETEVFIDTIIVNNEERTVEQALKRKLPEAKLTQLKYYRLASNDPSEVLSSIARFNPNKEVAYIRKGGKLSRWNNDSKQLEDPKADILDGTKLLRIDLPDTGKIGLSAGSETGVCYVCEGANQNDLLKPAVKEVFSNPHASNLSLLT